MSEQTAYSYDEDDVVEVGIGQLVVARHPSVLVAPALGSCVAVVLWDPGHGRGGMAHVMLPQSRGTASGADGLRFADVAVGELVRRLTEQGARKGHLVAKIAGGAAMFGRDGNSASVGKRNVDEVRRQLSALGIALLAEDVGGGHARTVELHLDTGVVEVRSFRFGTSKL